MPQNDVNHLRQVLEASGEGVYSIDGDGNCTYANERACRLLGYELEELLGANLHALVHHTRADGSRFPEEECPIYQASRSGEERRVTSDVFWRKDLSRFSVSYSSVPMVAADGTALGASVVFSDESDRVAAEAARSTALRRLAAEAAETLQLAALAERLGNRPEVGKRVAEAARTVDALQQELR